MSQHVFSYNSFVGQFPEFGSLGMTESQLQVYWTMGTQYINPNDGTYMAGDVLQLALDLMCAHLAKCFTQINAGEQQTVVSSASEGSVSVSLEPPPATSGWQWWLSATAYGQQLRSLLRAQSVAGFYVGGSEERSAFRKGGGLW